MKPIEKAIGYIEEHLLDEIALENVAQACRISKFHFARVFAIATGTTVMAYVRGRRLTEAAKRLNAGESDILEVALAFGYHSHSAFTRAFRSYFGVSPRDCNSSYDAIRDRLVERVSMAVVGEIEVTPPVIGVHPEFTAAGLSAIIAPGDRRGAEEAWKRFEPMLSKIPRELLLTPSVCHILEADAPWTEMNFFACVVVSGTAGLPDGLEVRYIPESKYAAFEFRGTVDEFERYVYAVTGEWFPQSDLEPKSEDFRQIHMVTGLPESPDVIHWELWCPIV